MPVPPIYLRQSQNPERTRLIREVIDGQQRIASVLEFMAGKYTLSKNIESPAAGKRFSDLTEKQRDSIRQYPFICEIFHGLDDPAVLQIFARLNTHSVKLNAQELRNGRFFGPFKRTAYDLAVQHLEFWRQQRIFSETAIARMNEVELTSELLVLMLDGLQDKKAYLDDFYSKFDETFSDRETITSRFKTTIDGITASCGDFLVDTEFRRPPMFYTLFGVVAHRIFGLPGVELNTPKKGKLSTPDADALSNGIRKLSDLISAAKDGEPPPRLYERVVTACLRQTDNIKPRLTRLDDTYKAAFGS
jgi:hypothetical protein